MKYHITWHALERYISRWSTSKDIKVAEQELQELLQGVAPTGKTEAGDQIMVSGLRPEIRFVIKDVDVCVTVLPRSTSLQHSIDLDSHFEIKDIEKQIEENVKNLQDIELQRERLAATKSKLLNDRRYMDSLLVYLRKGFK